MFTVYESEVEEKLPSQLLGIDQEDSYMGMNSIVFSENPQ